MIDSNTWSARADFAQKHLDTFFGAPWPQFLNNWSKSSPGSNDVFNYWWLAHVIDARLDAYTRTGLNRWLDLAQLTRQNIIVRNGNQLFNDYFDDMLWFGLALERLGRLASDAQATADAISLWRHCYQFGWNHTYGWSMAWRVTQLDYKNAPANGPFAILGARLFEVTGDRHYLDLAIAAFEWITETLRTDDGFIQDGINRQGDGAIDTHWRFTYNQGLYIGAGVALAHATGDGAYIDAVQPTIDTSIPALSDGEVFTPEGDDGDEGLFKGIYYRYAATALQTRPNHALASFIERSTEALWASAQTPHNNFLPGNNWHTPPSKPIPYSTYLSAIMALEAEAVITRQMPQI